MFWGGGLHFVEFTRFNIFPFAEVKAPLVIL